LSLAVLCVISAITAYTLYKLSNTSEPKNVFEEMYYAEMGAAEKQQATPLSNTEYFSETTAEYIEYQGKDFTTSTVKEMAKEASPYMLSVEYITLMAEKSPMGSGADEVKRKVNIKNNLWYREVKVEIEYQYILFNGRGYNRFSNEEGLYISFTAFVEGRRETRLEKFPTYGILEEDVKERIKKDLYHILNYWVDNYPDSKFKHDDFGVYEIVGSNRYLFV